MKFLTVILALTLFVTGCGSQKPQETKVQSPQMGVIDMAKAIKGHPKYNQLMDLKKQADTLAGQLEAEQLASAQQAQGASLSPAMSQSELDELNKVFEQEFNTKMSAKQEELNKRINVKADEVRRMLSTEMDGYNEQIEKEYDSQIFNLQLKLKTMQLSKEETAAMQADLEQLQAKRLEAVTTKQKQLAARMEELVAPEKKAVEEELGAYAKVLNEEIGKKAAMKQAEIGARSQLPQQPIVQSDQGAGQLQQQLIMKQKEFEALQGFIITNITEKTAKVATEANYDAVLTNVTVNVSAVDVTAKVIAECNK